MEAGHEGPTESGSARTSRDDEHWFAAVRRACGAHDPFPARLVHRSLAAARSELALAADLDYELLLLVEHSRELVGVRGGAASSYTLRFGNETVELLLRASLADDEGRAPLDGWVLPPGRGSVEARQVGGDGRSYAAAVDESGRFEFAELPSGLYRLWLQGADSATLGTPAFEI